MIQCYFGFVCGEDWYHEECILGYDQGKFHRGTSSGKNMIDDLLHPEDDAETEQKSKTEQKGRTENTIDDFDDFDDTQSKVPQFPNLDMFDSFICWKCVEKFPHIFKQIDVPEIMLTKLPFVEGVKTVEEWKNVYETFTNNSSPKTDIDLAPVDEGSHKRKIQEPESSSKRLNHEIPYSVFLKPGFRDHLFHLATSTEDSKLSQFLKHNEYLYKDDPVYEPPEDEDDENSSSTGSLFELGADALLTLPPEQAIEGLHAYNKIREKLKDFFKPFAEQGELVTEEKVREFFDQVKNDKS
jgi:E3 ubiquitin-protein ligase UBR7